MYDFSNPKLTKRAQRLRREMTNEERKLWYECLRDLPWRFRRQKVISKYIVDFYCAEKQLAIEVDGTEHREEKNLIKDRERTAFLNKLGVKVIRYSNKDIRDRFKNVCQDIYNRVEELPCSSGMNKIKIQEDIETSVKPNGTE